MRQPDPAAMLAMLLDKEYAADFYDAGTQLA
jgi:hypothetical protein